MLLYDNLIKIFDPSLFELKYNGGTFILNETESGATVKKVSLEYHGQLLHIDNNIFNKTDFLFKADDNTEKGLPKLRHGCDGILLIEKRDVKYLILIEIKSEYSHENISKAERQLSASYLRIVMLLNSISSFDISSYKKCGIIVSHPINTEKLNKIQKKKLTQPYNLNRYERQCLTFASSGYKSFSLSKVYSQLGKLPVRNELFFEGLPIFHFPVNSIYGQFNLDKILKQL